MIARICRPAGISLKFHKSCGQRDVVNAPGRVMNHRRLLQLCDSYGNGSAMLTTKTGTGVRRSLQRYSPELADRVIEHLVEGDSLRRSAKWTECRLVDPSSIGSRITTIFARDMRSRG